jgi:hypothetical protein
MSQLVYFITFVSILLTLISIMLSVHMWKKNVNNEQRENISTKLNSKSLEALKKTIDYNTTLIESNRNTMNSMNDNVGKNRDDIAHTKSKLRSQDELLSLSDIRELRRDIYANKEQIKENKDSLDSQYDRLYERVQTNSNMLFGYESQFTTLESRVEANSNMLFGYESQFKLLEERVETNSNALFGYESPFTLLEERVDTNSNALFGYESPFTLLEEKVDTNSNALFGYESPFTLLEEKVESNQAFIGGISSQMQPILDVFPGMQNKVETNSNALFGQENNLLKNLQSNIGNIYGRIDDNSNVLFGYESQFELLQERVQTNSLSIMKYDFDDIQNKVFTNSNMLFGDESEFEMLRGKVNDNSNALHDPNEYGSGLSNLVDAKSTLLGDNSEFDISRGKVDDHQALDRLSEDVRELQQTVLGTSEELDDYVTNFALLERRVDTNSNVLFSDKSRLGVPPGGDTPGAAGGTPGAAGGTPGAAGGTPGAAGGTAGAAGGTANTKPETPTITFVEDSATDNSLTFNTSVGSNNDAVDVSAVIEYKAVVDDADEQYTTVGTSLSGESQDITITGLSPNTSYDVRIAKTYTLNEETTTVHSAILTKETLEVADNFQSEPTPLELSQLWDSLKNTPYAMVSRTDHYMVPRSESKTTRKTMPNWESCLYDCFKDQINQTFSYNYSTLECMCTEQPDEGLTEKPSSDDFWISPDYNGFPSKRSDNNRFANGFRIKKKWGPDGVGAADCYNLHPNDRIGHDNCGESSFSKGPNYNKDNQDVLDEHFKLNKEYKFFEYE